MPPGLSIVIPSHSRADLLRLCLASVVRHAPPQTEIIVVDDASPSAHVSRAASEFPGVEVERLPRRGGFCRAANHGLGRARGRIIELLNDDTEVSPGWAAAAIACFADSRIGAVAPLVLQARSRPDATPRIDSAGDLYYLGGVARKRGHGQPLSDDFLQSSRVFGASGSSAFYRRDALLAAGLLPESFGAYFEDVDLSFRLHRSGYEVRYEPASRVWHRVSSSHGRPDRRLLAQQSLNEERVFWRNIPPAWLRQALPRHLAVLAGKALLRWEEGTLAPFLCGRLRLLHELASVRQQRRHLLSATTPAAWCVDEGWATVTAV